MSDLDAQIQVLINEAPQDGVTPQLVRAITPILKTIATKLRHSQYYILQNLEQDWLLTTIIGDRANPQTEPKNVIYAYPSLSSAGAAHPAAKQDPQIVAVPLPVTHILFQLAALQTVDSIVFFDNPNNTNTGIEVQREDFQHLIQLQLKQNLSAPRNLDNQIPPDLA